MSILYYSLGKYVKWRNSNQWVIPLTALSREWKEIETPGFWRPLAVKAIKSYYSEMTHR
jgi:hypothetical protein